MEAVELDMGVSKNQGCHFGGPYNKEYDILGFYIGVSVFWETTIFLIVHSHMAPQHADPSSKRPLPTCLPPSRTRGRNIFGTCMRCGVDWRLEDSKLGVRILGSQHDAWMLS